MSKISELDAVNKKIIKLLLEDARRSYSDIAERLDISESTARKRVMKLRESGIIEKFTIVLNPERAGKAVTAFVTITPTKGNFKTVADECSMHPEATEVYALAGNCGIIMKVQVDNLVELDAIVETLRVKTEVEEVQTCVVLRPIKLQSMDLVLEDEPGWLERR
ncbi:MAG: Lrp/AsnC family transcriptional regulator [Promethearchaeota archaeon]